MATMTPVRQPARNKLPRAMREQVEQILAESYDYMDSPVFRKRSTERELFDSVEGQLSAEPTLPPTAWYQPTFQDLENATAESPKLMSAKEEVLMFLRFNFAKRKLVLLQKLAKKDGLTRELADRIVLWHGRSEHYREYLVRTNLALVLAMAKRTRLGQVDFAEVVS